MHTHIACCIVLLSSASAFGQSPDRAERIVAAWTDWAESGETEGATIAVMRSGELVVSEGIGAAPDAALPLASLSKAITAACVARLPSPGALSMDTTVEQLIDAAGPAVDWTVGQLLTHSAGIGPDATQGDASLQESTAPPTEAIAMRAIGREPQDGEVGTFAYNNENYNNENYAIVGRMIEVATGRTYAEVCAEAVFEPYGIDTGTMAGEWGAHGPWGGWSMSAADYARFAWATFGPDGAMGLSPDAWPSVAVGDGANYGMGVLWREIRERHLIWSSGMLCWDGHGSGGYFASYGGEWLVVTLYADCLDGTSRLMDLDRALFDAAIK